MSFPSSSIGAYGALISNSISMENDPGRIFYRLTMGPEERVTSHPELVNQQVSGSSLLMANYLSLILPVRVGPILLVWWNLPTQKSPENSFDPGWTTCHLVCWYKNVNHIQPLSPCPILIPCRAGKLTVHVLASSRVIKLFSSRATGTLKRSWSAFRACRSECMT